MPQIRVITFDLDNTLWNLHPVILGAERRTVRWLAARVPQVRALYRDSNELSAIRESLIRERPGIVHDVSKLRKELTWRCLRSLGVGANRARRLSQSAFEVFLDARHEVEFFDGAIDTLQRLARHYTLGSLTNGNADPSRLGLDKVFSFSFSAAMVGAGKPATDMFEKALRHSGVRPEEAVHVGDHPVEDIRAAARVGMYTVWAKGLSRPARKGADASAEPTVAIERLPDLRAAITYIESL